MKKILYIKAQGLGDMIGGIPFLVQQKELGNEVYQTFYDMRHVNRGIDNMKDKSIQQRFKNTPMYGGRYNILEQLKKDGLIKDIVTIPFGKRNIIKFIVQNLRRYDEVVIPIKTRPAQVLGFFLGKKTRWIFKNVNDVEHYKILADGETNSHCPALHTYYNHTHFESDPVNIPKKYISIFPSIWERSIDIVQRLHIINHIRIMGYEIVLIGGERENRFAEELERHNALEGVVNYLGKTSIPQATYILQHASLTISGNGGQMWFANLVNQYCINIHTVSSFLMEPPVDNKYSFNLRVYQYPACMPCEAADSTRGEVGIKTCVFAGTDREGECRKAIAPYLIIKHINEILSK